MKVIKVQTQIGNRQYVYLECGHKIIWQGKKKLKVGDELECPEEPIGVEYGKENLRYSR